MNHQQGVNQGECILERIRVSSPPKAHLLQNSVEIDTISNFFSQTRPVVKSDIQLYLSRVSTNNFLIKSTDRYSC